MDRRRRSAMRPTRAVALGTRTVIVFAPKTADVLHRVPAGGGTPAPVTTLDTSRKEMSHTHPRFLPDGRHFLYLAISPQRDSSGIYVSALDSKETKLLVNADAGGAYAARRLPIYANYHDFEEADEDRK